MKSLRLGLSKESGYSVYLDSELLYGPDGKSSASDAIGFCMGFMDELPGALADRFTMEVSADHGSESAYEDGALAARKEVEIQG